MYPEYETRQLVLAGESYAGKYLPHIARKFKVYLSQSDLDVNFQTVLIGDPFTSPVRQRTSTHLVAKGAGMLDSTTSAQVAALRRLCENTVSTNWTAGPEACTKTLAYIDEMAGGVYSYDARTYDSDWDATEGVVIDFLTKSGQVKDLYVDIHIDKSTKTPIFEMSSSKVAEAYAYEEMLDWSQYYDGLRP